MRIYQRTIVVFAGLALLAGCAREADRPQKPAETPKAATPLPADVPVVYDTRLKPLPLTEDQTKEILAQAALVIPQGQPVWYIHVANNYRANGDMHYNVTVHFTPHFATPRLRKGRCFATNLLWWNFCAISAADRERFGIEHRQADPEQLKTAIRDYWQISPVDKPFPEEMTPPETPFLWPFRAPRGFTDEEVIEIVDFIRTSPKKPLRVNAYGSITSIGAPVDGSLPIMGMHRKEDGTISVTTGSVQGPLAGSGQRITLRRKGKAFEVLDVSLWMA